MSDTFISELRALVLEAQKLLDASSEGGNDGTADGLRERFENARSQFNDIYATAKKRVVAGGKYADEAIRENPYQSIAIAAGIGLLIGVLVARRSK